MKQNKQSGAYLGYFAVRCDWAKAAIAMRAGWQAGINVTQRRSTRCAIGPTATQR